MQRAASAGRLLHKAAGKPPQSPPERGSPSQRKLLLLQPVQARLLLAAVLAFLVWLAALAGMLRTSVSHSSSFRAATCPAREHLADADGEEPCSLAFIMSCTIARLALFPATSRSWT